ncbi:MAG: hypothetical protein PHE17_19415 [Thiothrix sp.]|uniref:hypothetical protein n=1 Tax=Thiothrix sp. TaxID=1032 RepID=UPI00263617C8|nr:hypothetical protein [Thiothrix sp.]MDD5395197.1 hypothetical protein [Thiothrix sp.]
MRELIKAVEYNIKPILWYIGTILVCLLIGCAIGTFWFHDVLFPPMQVTPITDGEWHGVTVIPAIVAASKVPAGVVAQIDLTITMPATHEQAKERTHGSNGRNNNGYDGLQLGSNDSNMDNPTLHGNKENPVRTFDFTSRGGGWFTSAGEIYHNPWDIAVIWQQMANGDVKVLTDEPGISFTVKQAVAVKPKPQLKWSAEYLYGTNGTHAIIAGKDIFGWLAVKGGVEFSNNQVEGKVGGEVRF